MHPNGSEHRIRSCQQQVSNPSQLVLPSFLFSGDIQMTKMMNKTLGAALVIVSAISLQTASASPDDGVSCRTVAEGGVSGLKLIAYPDKVFCGVQNILYGRLECRPGYVLQVRRGPDICVASTPLMLPQTHAPTVSEGRARAIADSDRDAFNQAHPATKIDSRFENTKVSQDDQGGIADKVEIKVTKFQFPKFN
jgi:hypothetical protein